MYFSTRNRSPDEKFKRTPYTYIKTFLIPDFLVKNYFFMFRKRLGCKESWGHGGAFLYAKTSEADLHIFRNFFAPSSNFVL
eukprot:UN12319